MIVANEVWTFAWAPFPSLLSIRPAFPSLACWLPGCWLRGIDYRPFTLLSWTTVVHLRSWQMSGNHAKHMLLCASSKKQTTTIILISALFGPLQQSSRLSSEGTWASLIHHREYLNRTAAIVCRSLLLIRSAATMPTSCFQKAAWLRESLGCHPEIIFTKRSKSK